MFTIYRTATNNLIPCELFSFVSAVNHCQTNWGLWDDNEHNGKMRACENISENMGKGGKKCYLTFHYCLPDGRLCWPLRCHVAAWLGVEIYDTWRQFDPVKLWWRHRPPLIVKPSDVPSYPPYWMLSAAGENVCQDGADLYFPAPSKTCFWARDVEIINPIVSTEWKYNVELKLFPKSRKTGFIYHHAACLFPNSIFWATEFSRHSVRILYVYHRRITQLYNF